MVLGKNRRGSKDTTIFAKELAYWVKIRTHIRNKQQPKINFQGSRSQTEKVVQWGREE